MAEASAGVKLLPTEPFWVSFSAYVSVRFSDGDMASSSGA